MKDCFLNFQPYDISSVKYSLINDQFDVPSCESSKNLGAEATLLSAFAAFRHFPTENEGSHSRSLVSFKRNWHHLTAAKFNFNIDTLLLQCSSCCETDCFVEHPRIYLFVW